MDLFWEFQEKKIMGRLKRTIHIDRKTKSLWQKDDALYLVGPEERSLLWIVKIRGNGQYWTLLTIIDLFEPFFGWKKARKKPNWKRQRKVICLHDNSPSHTAESVRYTLEILSWEVLSHAAYSPDLGSSDYHLFSPMGHALAEQRFGFVRRCEKIARRMVRSKRGRFLLRQIARKMEKMYNKRWSILRIKHFLSFFRM